MTADNAGSLRRLPASFNAQLPGLDQPTLLLLLLVLLVSPVVIDGDHRHAEFRQSMLVMLGRLPAHNALEASTALLAIAEFLRGVY
ncbi:MAG: hypothetical protein ACI92S_002026 [Planctomycetaceae bacterium]